MTGAEFREARRKLGLTQAELAPRIGYVGKRSAQTISDMETGKQAITPQAAMLMHLLIGAAERGEKDE